MKIVTIDSQINTIFETNLVKNIIYQWSSIGRRSTTPTKQLTNRVEYETTFVENKVAQKKKLRNQTLRAPFLLSIKECGQFFFFFMGFPSSLILEFIALIFFTYNIRSSFQTNLDSPVCKLLGGDSAPSTNGAPLVDDVLYQVRFEDGINLGLDGYNLHNDQWYLS